MRNLIIILNLLAFAFSSKAQTELNYYLPDESFNPDIPAPSEIIGHEVGEWHVTHDKLVQYMYAISMASERISIEETGRTFEGRPLLILTITSPSNHSRLEDIRSAHIKLSDPQSEPGMAIEEMPAVVYMGFSIHGNEPSGSNASLLTAYYLAASNSEEVKTILENTVILFDPSFNPDGLQRFATWVNSRKSQVTSADPQNQEQNEPWPGGRTNHYWFDLNRDWLPAQLPESRARLKTYHSWKPNVLTDHHEMGHNSTFFFQPGIPSRNNPLTPNRTYDLTEEIARYHARALDSIGSLYYSKESYDDFYYGKGSSYPDVNGGIGILFEQAGSDGHLKESVNGILTFPFTIRNQFNTTLSTLRAATALREDLLRHQQDFYSSP
ncbi:MAG: M14 family metallopeptidase [Cyclobacteriaceae bacterium]